MFPLTATPARLATHPPAHHSCCSRPDGPHGTPPATPHRPPWEQKRHWFIPRPHLLLSRALSVARGCAFQACLSHPQLAYLSQHRVSGRALLPGAAMLELALAAAHVAAGERLVGCCEAGELCV